MFPYRLLHVYEYLKPSCTSFSASLSFYLFKKKRDKSLPTSRFIKLCSDLVPVSYHTCYTSIRTCLCTFWRSNSRNYQILVSMWNCCQKTLLLPKTHCCKKKLLLKFQFSAQTVQNRENCQ